MIKHYLQKNKNAIAGICLTILSCTSILSSKGQNVGIGTNSPAWKLDIRGSSPDDGQLISVGNSDQTHRLLLFGGRLNDPSPYISWKAGDPLRLATDQNGFTEYMRIASDGKVGIGTPTPAALLDVKGSVRFGTAGTLLNSIIKTSISVSFSGIGANSSGSVQFLVSNAAVTGSVSISPSSGLPEGLVISYARVASAGIVEFILYNATNSTIVLPNTTFYITIIQ